MSPMRHVISNNRGAVLFATFLFCLLITGVMLYLMNSSYQRSRLIQTMGEIRTRNYYRAQAGLVDAFWRLRGNRNLAGVAGAGGFDNAATTLTYFIDMDSDAISAAQTPACDIRVNIAARNTTAGNPQFGLRRVTASGLDN